MEGVLVSATPANSTVTVTVVSDEHGRPVSCGNRSSPVNTRCTSGRRATTWQDPGTVEVTSQKTAAADLKLQKAKIFRRNSSSAEWINSSPAQDTQRLSFWAA